MTAPAALAQYENGRLPPHVLVPIGHGAHRLYAPAAEAFRRMDAAAARDGVRLAVTDSYRTFAGQQDVARRRGLYSEGGLAAVPGTSNHGWGLAVDLDLDAKGQQWMRENAAYFGFSTIPREPWHWEMTGAAPAGATTPAPASEESGGGGGIAALGRLVGAVLSGATWQRLGLIVAGVALIAGGLLIVVRDAIPGGTLA